MVEVFIGGFYMNGTLTGRKKSGQKTTLLLLKRLMSCSCQTVVSISVAQEDWGVSGFGREAYRSGVVLSCRAVETALWSLFAALAIAGELRGKKLVFVFL